MPRGHVSVERQPMRVRQLPNRPVLGRSRGRLLELRVWPLPRKHGADQLQRVRRRVVLGRRFDFVTLHAGTILT